MEQSDRREAHAKEIDGPPQFQAHREQRRDEAVVPVLFFLKDVLVDAEERLHRVIVGVDINRRLHHRVESADLVEPEDVIDVVVREQDRVAAPQVVPKRLLTQIGGRVDEDRAFLTGVVDELNRRPGASARVTRVDGGADLAVARDLRHAAGRPGAEKDETKVGGHGVSVGD